MLALLLAAAAALLPIPTASVSFSSGETVTVTGPADSFNHPEFPWTLQQILLSPRGDAAAVRFCFEPPGFHFCDVYLARPGLPALTLKNSNVTRLLWTADGRYLIGAGKNTVRLWNLNGTVRIATPKPPLIELDVTQSASVIGRLWLDRGDLCVAAQDQLFDAQGQQKRQTVTTTRYRVPTLRGVTGTTYPLTPRQQEADCKLITKPI
jgi:WD40 repeat protein